MDYQQIRERMGERRDSENRDHWRRPSGGERR